MSLPNDIARCNGRTLPAHTNPSEALLLAPECRECRRKEFDGLDRAVMMAAPAPSLTPCHSRIWRLA